MKALSLTQPWATLVAIGAKQWETRSWQTSFRGTIAIHASKGFPGWAKDYCGDDPFHRYLPPFIDQLPLGAIIAVADLTGIITTTAWLAYAGDTARLQHEYHFGEYSAGRFAWKLENVRKLSEPVPCKGSLSLWQVDRETSERVNQLCT